MNSGSLLPYLNGKNSGIRLVIDQEEIISQYSGERSFVFKPILENHLFQIHSASISTDLNVPLEKVFLLVSKDNYSHKEPFLTNKKIDEIWGKTFSFYKSSSFDYLIFFGEQFSFNGKLKKFSPLFYCKKTHRYFIPPCPNCGTILDIAEDDLILEQNGLEPYTSTLERYLICPNCLGKGQFLFFKNKKDINNRGKVLGFPDLLLSWKRLLEERIVSGGLPCFECNEKTFCFGGDRAILGRIIPFSFYPFYLLAFKSPTYHVKDFLSLVSGFNREKNNKLEFFYHEDSPQRFLEVLFLKLVLLKAVFNELFLKAQPITRSIFDLFEKIWIKVPEASEFLPKIWGFYPIIIGLSGDGISSHLLFQQPVNHLLYQFGIFWFTVLGANCEKNLKKTEEMLNKLRGFIDEGIDTFFDQANQLTSTYFPYSVIWSQEKLPEIPKTYIEIWDKTIMIGLKCMEKSLKSEVEIDLIKDEIDSLLLDLKCKMINKEIVKTQPTTEESKKGIDLRIAEILSTISKKWENNIKLTEKSKGVHKAPSIKDVKKEKEISDISLEETLPLDFERTHEEEELPETVIISSRTMVPGDKSIFIQKEQIPEEEVFNEHDKLDQGQGKKGMDEDDVLEETVILRPSRDDK